MSDNNNKCCICFDKTINNNCKCKQCKNCLCDICFANIIYKGTFALNFKNHKSVLECPFCKIVNIFNTQIHNFNVNDKLIRLLLEQMNKDNIEYNNLMDEANYLKNELFKSSNYVQELEELLEQEKARVSELQISIDENLFFENKERYKRVLTLEYKPEREKLNKIKNIIKNTKRETILYNEIKNILDS
jgi:hypothetical protein